MSSNPRWTRRPEGSTWGDFGPDDQVGRINLLTPEKVRQGVAEVHDLHVWTLVPGRDMATAHLTTNGQSDRVLADAQAILAERGLNHSTVQVEPPGVVADCPTESDL